LSHSLGAETGACEDFTTEPACLAPCVWFVDEGEAECLEASEVPASAASANVAAITLKFCNKITEQTECFGYAIDPAEYEAGDPLVVTEIPKKVTVCTWNPNLDICTSAVIGKDTGAGALPMQGGEIPEIPEPEGMGAGAFQFGEGFGPGQGFGTGEGSGTGAVNGADAGQNVATGEGETAGTGALTDEQSALVSEMVDKAIEMYNSAAEQNSAGAGGEAPEAPEVEPPKAETYCPTITDPAKCTGLCVWATTHCMELDRLMASNPLPEESNPLPEESSKIPVWKLATFAIVGLLIGVLVGTACVQCRHKETNSDVFVPLDRHV